MKKNIFICGLAVLLAIGALASVIIFDSRDYEAMGEILSNETEMENSDIEFEFISNP